MRMMVLVIDNQPACICTLHALIARQYTYRYNIVCTRLPLHCDSVQHAWVSVTKVSGWAATHVTGIVGTC